MRDREEHASATGATHRRVKQAKGSTRRASQRTRRTEGVLVNWAVGCVLLAPGGPSIGPEVRTRMGGTMELQATLGVTAPTKRRVDVGSALDTSIGAERPAEGIDGALTGEGQPSS
jgi:hypothetical protein